MITVIRRGAIDSIPAPHARGHSKRVRLLVSVKRSTVSELFNTDVVFAGTVQAMSPVEISGSPILRYLRVVFAVSSAFRGLQGSVVDVVTPDSGAACGYAFKLGGQYLVYARRLPDSGRLEVSLGSRTRPLAEAGEDLSFFQTLSTATGGARVFGTIQHWERDLATRSSHDFGLCQRERPTQVSMSRRSQSVRSLVRLSFPGSRRL